MIDLFKEVDTEKMFHIIDTIVADDILENAKSNEGLVEVRAKINQIYGRMGGEEFTSSSGAKQSPPKYVQPDENGLIPGIMEKPVG